MSKKGIKHLPVAEKKRNDLKDKCIKAMKKVELAQEQWKHFVKCNLYLLE